MQPTFLKTYPNFGTVIARLTNSSSVNWPARIDWLTGLVAAATLGDDRLGSAIRAAHEPVRGNRRDALLN